MKRIFLDTNVLLETLFDREQKDACDQILQAGLEDDDMELCASYLTFANMAYIMKRQKVSRNDIYEAEQYMQELMTVLPMDGSQLSDALKKQVGDFEDMLQYQCAVKAQCDCIVTINTSDFAEFSEIPFMSPKAFLRLLDDARQAS